MWNKTKGTLVHNVAYPYKILIMTWKWGLILAYLGQLWAQPLAHPNDHITPTQGTAKANLRPLEPF